MFVKKWSPSFHVRVGWVLEIIYAKCNDSLNKCPSSLMARKLKHLFHDNYNTKDLGNWYSLVQGSLIRIEAKNIGRIGKVKAFNFIKYLIFPFLAIHWHQHEDVHDYKNGKFSCYFEILDWRVSENLHLSKFKSIDGSVAWTWSWEHANLPNFLCLSILTFG